MIPRGLEIQKTHVAGAAFRGVLLLFARPRQGHLSPLYGQNVPLRQGRRRLFRLRQRPKLAERRVFFFLTFVTSLSSPRQRARERERERERACAFYFLLRHLCRGMTRKKMDEV